MLMSNPRVASIELPLPDLATRARVCKLADPSLTEAQTAQLAKHSAGLKAVQIHDLLSPDDNSELDDETRYRFILGVLGDSSDAEARARKLAALTRSMNEDEIRHLLNPQLAADNASKDQAIAEVLTLLRTRKRELIEKECLGLIEFMDPQHGFEAVG